MGTVQTLLLKSLHITPVLLLGGESISALRRDWASLQYQGSCLKIGCRSLHNNVTLVTGIA